MKMPEEFNELAEYNNLRTKGLLFTEEHKARMAKMQEAYNEWIKQTY